MPEADGFIAYYEDERRKSQQVLDDLLSGKLRLKEQRPPEGSWIETTQQSIEEYKRKIAELDSLLAKRKAKS